MKKSNTIEFEIDLAKPVVPTALQKRRLSALAKKPDSSINLTDIPETSQSFWDNATRGGLYRPVKRQLTVRIDGDIIEWLKKQGSGYHSRLNRILREAMIGDLSRSPRV